MDITQLISLIHVERLVIVFYELKSKLSKYFVVTGGDCITAGYYHMAEETAECYKTDPDGTRWFESGDIVEQLPNGTLKVIDRRKDLTKLYNGEFVSLGKVGLVFETLPYVF